jgi:hypothetical protein
VNGEASSTYTYKVRIDQAGKFVIGPAVLFINGVRSQSKALRLSVENVQIIDSAYVKKIATEPHDVSFKLSVDKTQLFVGERVKVVLSFTGKRDAVKLEQFEEPKIPEFNQGAKEGPLLSSQAINGSEYVTATWKWEFFPKKAGQFVIPACGANYQSEQEAHDNLSLFSPFFRVRTERKSIYSNACSLAVEELPAYQGHVDAVGNFKNFDAKINPSVAQEGEGMVFLLEIEGDGNLAQVPALQLKNMPVALKWYDSKQYMRETPGIHGLPVKCFEYIVQGLSHGSWEIPPQLFTYFDVEKRRYITFKTASCAVTVKSNPGLVKNPSSSQSIDSNLAKNAGAQDETVLPLNTWGSWRPVHHRGKIPWLLFFLLICLPGVWWIIVFIRKLVSCRADYFKQRFAFKLAHKKIDQSARKGLEKNMHTIFLELFADRLQSSSAIISPEIIDQVLHRAGFSDDDMRSWESFYIRMYERAFFESNYAQQDNDSIIKEAHEWVKRLEKIL